MKTVLDLEMLQTIFTEIGLAVETEGSTRGNYKRSWNDHVSFSVQFEHDLDKIRNCFPSDGMGIEHFQEVISGMSNEGNQEFYNSIIPAMATLLQWLVWIRENDFPDTYNENYANDRI